MKAGVTLATFKSDEKIEFSIQKFMFFFENIQQTPLSFPSEFLLEYRFVVSFS